MSLKSFVTTKETEATLRGSNGRGLECFTQEKIPVFVDLHIKWRLYKPLNLITRTNFKTPYNLLEELSQGILYGIVNMEHYQQMTYAGGKDENVQLGSFIRSVTGKVEKQLTEKAKEYGIQITGKFFKL